MMLKTLAQAAVAAGVLLAVGSAAPASAACAAPIPVVAHRGGTEKYVENTRNAFRYATTVGAGIWETDVRFDAGGTPYLMHDATIDRTTTGTGAVADLDLSAARAAGVRTNDGQVVPSLFEFLTDASARNARVLLELKADPTPQQLAKVLARLDWTHMRPRVVVMSFDPQIIAEVRAAAPDLAVGLVADPGYVPVAQLAGYDAYIKHYYSVTAARLDEWSGPLDVYAWTVDGETDWSRMQWYTAEPGRLDGVITNRPAAYLAWAKTRDC
jgi:glycerophosphoryl diester phosphodiesterase